MDFMLSFMFVMVAIIGLENQENDDIKFEISSSNLPPQMDWLCEPVNVTLLDHKRFFPVQDSIIVSDQMPTDISEPEFNSSIIILDQMPTDISEPEFNFSRIISDQIAINISEPEYNSSIIISDQMPTDISEPEFNSSIIISDQMPTVVSVPDVNSPSGSVSVGMDKYISRNFTSPSLEFKSTEELFNKDFSNQSYIIDGLKLLNFAALLSVHLVQAAAVLFVASLLWNSIQQTQSLQQEIDSVVKCTSKYTQLEEMKNMLKSEHSQFTKAAFDLARFDKKMDRMSSELDDENKDLEQMYKCLMEWKHDWNEQSHKIKQIKPDQLRQLSDMSNYNVDQFIQEQKKELRDIYYHAEGQITLINQDLVDSYNSMKEISANIDNIHDDLNDKSASQF